MIHDVRAIRLTCGRTGAAGTAAAPTQTAETALVNAFAQRKNAALLMRGAVFYPAKFDVGAHGARVAVITERDDAGYTISFDSQANCKSLGCVVLELSASPEGSIAAGPFNPNGKLASGIDAEFDEGCGAHGCDKTITWKMPGVATGFPVDLGGKPGGAPETFIYSVRAVGAHLDKAGLFAYANDSIAAGSRSINDILVSNAIAKNPGFSTTAPLLYPPSLGISGQFVTVKNEEDGGYLISFSNTPDCKDTSCLSTEIAATKSPSFLEAKEKLLSGTPAGFDEGCGAHTCDQTLEFVSQGFTYSIRNIVPDPERQTPPVSFFLAAASAMEKTGPRRPTH